MPAAQAIIAHEFGHPEVARSPLVFPGPELIGDSANVGTGGELLGSRVRNYYLYADADEYKEWESVFEPIVYS